MPHGIARRAQLVQMLIAALGLVLLPACESFGSDQTPLPSPGFKPTVSLVKPENNATVALNDSVPIDAIAQDGSGILRVDFTVNGVLVDSQTLFVASRRFEYEITWKPTGVGQNALTIVAYNVNNVASDPVSITVNVSSAAPTGTGVPATATQTPYVIFVTPTPPPTPRAIVTPIVTVITATVLPTFTPAPTMTSTQTKTVTAAPSQTQSMTPPASTTPH
jgi:hypothetical protein